VEEVAPAPAAADQPATDGVAADGVAADQPAVDRPAADQPATDGDDVAGDDVAEYERAGERYRAARAARAAKRGEAVERREAESSPAASQRSPAEAQPSGHPEAGERVEPEPERRRPLGGLAPAARGRSPLDRLNFSDMVDADRLALSRRRRGGVPLRRRETPAQSEPAGTNVNDGRGTAVAASENAKPVSEESTDQTRAADSSRASDRPRPFAGLAEQVRAAGSGQARPARSSADPPAVPASPPPTPAETA
jgi:hypothetical protein